MNNNNYIVEIEFCKNCRLHKHNTWHDEAKYLSTFEKVKAAVQSKAQCDVVQSEIAIPVLGGFEIRHHDNLLYSKKESQLWPHPEAVADKIAKYLEAYKKNEDYKQYLVQIKPKYKKLIDAERQQLNGTMKSSSSTSSIKRQRSPNKQHADSQKSMVKSSITEFDLFHSTIYRTQLKEEYQKEQKRLRESGFFNQTIQSQDANDNDNNGQEQDQEDKLDVQVTVEENGNNKEEEPLKNREQSPKKDQEQEQSQNQNQEEPKAEGAESPTKKQENAEDNANNKVFSTQPQDGEQQKENNEQGEQQKEAQEQAAGNEESQNKQEGEQQQESELMKGE